ncbi:hypothetical protein [Nocardia wallacei]|uniref:hypothetical protein n=1 Tax=Nocardia wallacei TaxID=480035 RepID=UPI0024582CDD|nr:hypothetical protein [Nocardia wallacei]
MITRHDDRRGATLYGDAPLVDHEGYAVEVAAEDHANLMSLKVALEADMQHAIRADLPPKKVREHIARCQAWLEDHQEK